MLLGKISLWIGKCLLGRFFPYGKTALEYRNDMTNNVTTALPISTHYLTQNDCTIFARNKQHHSTTTKYKINAFNPLNFEYLNHP